MRMGKGAVLHVVFTQDSGPTKIPSRTLVVTMAGERAGLEYLAMTLNAIVLK